MKSGKKFRRPNFKPYMGRETFLFVDGNKILFFNTHSEWQPRVEDITATDWVLEEEKREFTFKEIFEAVINVSSTSDSQSNFEKNLKTALGYDNSSMSHYCEGLFCDECNEWKF
jgi:hypothetical protein